MNRVTFRTEFKHLPSKFNWFPGHMRKAMRTLGAEMKKADIFIEVRDARIPRTSENPELLGLLPKGMKRLVIYNKFDLVPSKVALEQIKLLQESNKLPFYHLSTKQNMNINKLLAFIDEHANPQFKTVGSQLMIGGIPNVGKSTIINTLRARDAEINHRKKSGARTGGIPCVTRNVSGFKVKTDPPVFVYDTPGVIIPKIENTTDALKLCLCNCVRDGIVETELLCDFGLYVLNRQRLFDYVKRYELPHSLPTENVHDLMHAIATRFKLRDKQTAFDKFLLDFREGRLGKVFLDIDL